MRNITDKYINFCTTNNEKNALRLFMALRPTCSIAVAFAEIYLMLNQLAPGQTVREYCQNVLGYSTNKYENTFTQREQQILEGDLDPKYQNVSLLFKLLHSVCGLSQDGSKWLDPKYPLEFHIHIAKNGRTDAMYSMADLTDRKLQMKFQELDNSISSATQLAGEKVGRDVNDLIQSTKSELQNYLNKQFSFSMGEKLMLCLLCCLMQSMVSISTRTGTSLVAWLPVVFVVIAVYLWYITGKIKADLRNYIQEAQELELHGMSSMIQRKLKQICNI